MKREIEALLFATDAPLTTQRLKSLLPEADGKEIRAAIDELNAEYAERGHAFAAVEFGGGWQIATRPEFAPLIQQLYRGKRYVRLSRAGLEVLAIIAYRQPITRMEIEEIRGVQASGVLSTLMERNLVTVLGRADTVGNPILYGTTREFLNHMGLKGLHQLPQLPELERVVEDRDELKAFAEQLGEQISDEDFETVAVQGDEVLVVVGGTDDSGHGEPGPRQPAEAPEEPAADEPAANPEETEPEPSAEAPERRSADPEEESDPEG